MADNVIDFHAHIYPEKIAAKAVAGIEEFYSIAMQKDGTAGGLIASGRECGIGRFVVFSAAAVPAQVQAINDYIAASCREHPEFSGFGTLHPDMEKPLLINEIERIIGLGLKGIKFHPDMQLFNIDDERMMDVYAALEGRLPIIFHTGDYRYTFSHPSRLARVLDNFPKLCVIAAHFGGWSLFDIAYDCFYKRRCYFDVSSSLPFMGLRRAAELIHAYGAERFLFGSDYPMWDPALCLEEFMKLDIADNEKEQILWKNAHAILGEA
ncbi:MAG: amidohydrolase family protein [Treponema sp.]|jgi:predicted TIM-barrel fold metal-dependent hydrolase|nr:amidohydrolase family protein [Treponema sp.]